jgi:hypothetical protein
MVLFDLTTFSSAKLQPNIPLPQDANSTCQSLLGQVGQNSGEPGLAALTLALATDAHYQLAAQGSYNSAHNDGSYAVWQRVQA